MRAVDHGRWRVDAEGDVSTTDVAKEYCPTCGHITKPFYGKCPKCEGDRNRLHVDRLAEVIRELKSSVDGPLSPDRERELVKLLYLYSHPDPKGLLDWIENQKRAPASSKRRR